MKKYCRSNVILVATAGLLLSLSACAQDTGSDAHQTVGELEAPAGSLDSSGALPEASVTALPVVSNSVAQLISAGSRPDVVVYKNASCSCCKDWVTYLEDEGFQVEAINHENLDQIKAQNGLHAPGLKSCHTALIDGYVVEGHVPVSDIERLLAERPDIVGLTAPGMPMRSPGMGSLIPDDYDVLAFRKDGSSRIFSSY
ncbi:DUF411 domain-containing protein [Granulosicoccus antarcticus]|uniref:Metal-binding protein n=1 Tax=Granulosicoccus antarcticus IMCC3135 TaxID=1192854 RepID=A0A2Z2P2B4_9GAMM|nr:DUF411 domain-containing protein [Granulosicoccus antarcticus]ASJ73804.1 hypothetical protein IMCC3135_18625 [Granulosicoccus antarcticus IMCC3135]